MTARGRVVQRHVLYPGEINDTQELVCAELAAADPCCSVMARKLAIALQNAGSLLALPRQ
jgi:hypothetical protein